MPIAIGMRTENVILQDIQLTLFAVTRGILALSRIMLLSVQPDHWALHLLQDTTMVKPGDETECSIFLNKN